MMTIARPVEPAVEVDTVTAPRATGAGRGAVDRWGKLFFVAAFALLVGVPGIQQPFQIVPVHPLTEKRTKAPAPSLDAASLFTGAFMSDFDSYYNDRSGFRDALIRLNNQVHLSVFHVSPNPRVIVGKNGWLYYNDTLRDFVNEWSPRTRFEQDIVARRIIGLRDGLVGRGIRFFLVIIPNKNTIYPEFMPDRFERRGGTRLCDRLAARLRRAGVRVLCLEDVLRRHKRETFLYEQRGTHWNTLGGFYSCQAILSELGGKYGIRYPQPSALGYRVGRAQGDLTEMVEGVRGCAERTPCVALRPVPLADAKLPSTLWYGDSFTNVIEAYLRPQFASFTFININRGPMAATLMPRLADTRIVVLALVERNLRNALPHYPLPSWPAEIAASDADHRRSAAVHDAGDVNMTPGPRGQKGRPPELPTARDRP
jgi:hypothetical protein